MFKDKFGSQLFSVCCFLQFSAVCWPYSLPIIQCLIRVCTVCLILCPITFIMFVNVWTLKFISLFVYLDILQVCRALTPLFGNGAGAHGIGKISDVLTKIGKFDIVLIYDVSIARLILIIKLSYCTMRKGRERSKCYYILLFCDEKKMENQKKKKFFFFLLLSNWDFFPGIGKKTYFLALGMGPNFGPKIGWSRALVCIMVSTGVHYCLKAVMISMAIRALIIYLPYIPQILGSETSISLQTLLTFFPILLLNLCVDHTPSVLSLSLRVATFIVCW